MPSYKNIEISFSRFEHDSLRFMTFNSPALGGNRGDVSIFLPPDHRDMHSVPCIILMHGVFGSCWSWAMNGGAHRTALSMIRSGEIRPVALLMPSDGLRGQGTGYLPHRQANFEEWIMDDVPGCAREVAPCLKGDPRVFLAGLSMGGYGALRLGAKYGAGRVAGISAHSAGVEFQSLSHFLGDAAGHYELGCKEEETSILYWMRKNKASLPPIRFDCGVKDDFIEANRRLHAQLESEGIPHVFEEFPGAHLWCYWEEHLRDTLRFFDSLRGNAA